MLRLRFVRDGGRGRCSTDAESHRKSSFALAAVVEMSGRSSGAATRKKPVARVAPMVTSPTMDKAFFQGNVSTDVRLL